MKPPEANASERPSDLNNPDPAAAPRTALLRLMSEAATLAAWILASRAVTLIAPASWRSFWIAMFSSVIRSDDPSAEAAAS
jgi:hypothetical protein